MINSKKSTSKKPAAKKSPSKKSTAKRQRAHISAVAVSTSIFGVVIAALLAVIITFGCLFTDELGALIRGEKLYTQSQIDEMQQPEIPDEEPSGPAWVQPEKPIVSDAVIEDVYINTKITDFELNMIANAGGPGGFSIEFIVPDQTYPNGDCMYSSLSVEVLSTETESGYVDIGIAIIFYPYSGDDSSIAAIYSSIDFNESGLNATKGWNSEFIDEATGKLLVDIPAGSIFGDINGDSQFIYDHIFGASSFIPEV